METKALQQRALGFDKFYYGEAHINCRQPHIHTSIRDTHPINPETLGWSTGWTDAHGTPIYSGDITEMTIPDGTTRRFVVEFGSQKRMLVSQEGFIHDGNPVEIVGFYFNWKGHKLFPSVYDDMADYKRMTVIGNIWNDKKLLEENWNDEEGGAQ